MHNKSLGNRRENAGAFPASQLQCYAQQENRRCSMKLKRPTPKEFNSTQYRKILGNLDTNMSELEFERLTEVVVYEILQNYEEFEQVEKGPAYRGPPFDFFGFKNGAPYVVEYKGSLNSFNTPGETQKRRLQEVLDLVKGLNAALLQVKIAKGQYRIFYDEEMEILFQGRRSPIKPIVDWVKQGISKA